MRIALLDEDQEEAQLLVAALQASRGEEPIFYTPSSDGAALRSALSGETSELLILALTAQGRLAMDLLRWLRVVRQSHIPVIVLSDRADASDVAAALAAGANDYMIRPYRPLDLSKHVPKFRSPLHRASLRTDEAANWTLAHEGKVLQYPGSPADTFGLQDRPIAPGLSLFHRLGHTVTRSLSRKCNEPVSGYAEHSCTGPSAFQPATRVSA